MSEPIILSPKGVPFPSKTAAAKHITSTEGIDDTTHTIQAYQNGFAIVDLAALAKAGGSPGVAPPPDRHPPVPQPKVSHPGPLGASDHNTDEYFWVRFHEAQSENDDPVVALSVNGSIFQCQRGARVPLPKPYLEVADHATYQRYVVMPGVPRKISRPIRAFPYDLLGPATRKDFAEFLKSGNAIRDLDIENMAAQEQLASAQAR